MPQKMEELIQQFELLKEDAVGAQQMLGGRAKGTETTIPHHTMGPDKPLGTRTRTVPLPVQPAPAFMPMLNVNTIDPLAPVPNPFQKTPLNTNPNPPPPPQQLFNFPVHSHLPSTDFVLPIGYALVRQTRIRTATASQ